jgi:hypothetical protein
VKFNTDELMARMAAADPAQGRPVAEAARGQLWQRIIATDAPQEVHRVRPRRRSRMRFLIVIVPALLVIAAGGVASGVIHFGKPERTFPLFTNPRTELGALTPGTVRVLPLATPDPDGGPPWGLRVLSTTRGVGCIQVGRLVDGKLGALGQDGAFHDDGRFHPLPVNGLFDQFSCAALDGKGRIFNNLTVGEQAASGAWAAVGACYPPTAGRYERDADSTVCPQRDERNIYYGLLGPEARSITYASAGHSRTLATSGADGAYLLVTRAPAHNPAPYAHATTANVVPVHGPITAIHYRDGVTCHLTARSWIGGASACTPSLSVPVGYAPVPIPTRAEVRSPLHVRVVRKHRLLRAGEGRYEVLVSFTSRVPITTDRGNYSASWRDTQTPLSESGSPSRADVAAGQTVTLHIGLGGPHQPTGLVRGHVTLTYATGPALLEGPGTIYLPVGSFAVRVP